MVRQFLTVFFFALVYAVVRYAGFGQVSAVHIPVYLLNKAVSMTAAYALLMASLGAMRGEWEVFDFWRKGSMNLVFIHVIISLGVFNRAYFPKWFEGEMMNLTGELTLLMGALGLYCLWRLLTFEMTPKVRRIMMISVSAFVSVHLFVMGYDGWLAVEKWNGGLPPITLLSFLLVVSSLAVFVRASDRCEAFLSGNARVLASRAESL